MLPCDEAVNFADNVSNGILQEYIGRFKTHMFCF